MQARVNILNLRLFIIASSWRIKIDTSRRAASQGCHSLILTTSMITQKQPQGKNNASPKGFWIVMLNEVKHLGLERDLRQITV
jgi:hypothetical protein